MSQTFVERLQYSTIKYVICRAPLCATSRSAVRYDTIYYILRASKSWRVAGLICRPGHLTASRRCIGIRPVTPSRRFELFECFLAECDDWACLCWWQRDVVDIDVDTARWRSVSLASSSSSSSSSSHHLITAAQQQQQPWWRHTTPSNVNTASECPSKYDSLIVIGDTSVFI